MVFTKKIENFLRFSGLRESGVAAQIAKHDDDLAAMAFEDLLIALRDNQFGKLRREKALKPSDPPQLLDLFGDARLQASIQLRHLVGALAQLAQQPRVLDRDHRLRREVFDQPDL